MKKKYISTTDKYNWITEKGKKTYIPNKDSTNNMNLEAVERSQLYREQEVHTNSILPLNNINLVKHDNSKKLSVIVPYRDREDHLHELVSKLPSFLEQQNIDYRITIVEQDDKKQFNKGTLNNIGFLETKTYDYFCFHDVDMLPIDSDYGYSNKAKNNFGMAIHLAKSVEQFDFKELPGYFGGVVLVDNFAFKLINGYSINYWGWGLEDDDFHRRCYTNSRVITIYRNGVYKSLPHKHNYNEKTYGKNFATYSKNINLNNDGLSQTKYKVISTEILTDRISIIKVSI